MAQEKEVRRSEEAYVHALTPRFRHPERRLIQNEALQHEGLRFLTARDDPPFLFKDPLTGQMSGFHFELARSICLVLKTSCTIRAFEWSELDDALRQDKGDIVLAGLALTPQRMREAQFSRPYFRSVGRFVTRAGFSEAGLNLFEAVSAGDLRVGVVKRTKHATYLQKAFPKTDTVVFLSLDQALKALMKQELDMVFADGLELTFWLEGKESKGCCTFVFGAFHEPLVFGDGFSAMLKKQDKPLKTLIDQALDRLEVRGDFQLIYLKYFPIAFH